MNLVTEIYRKSLHLLLILIPMAFVHFGKEKTLTVLVPLTAIIVLLDYLRRKNPQIKLFFGKIFNPILREHEIGGEKLCGASWVFIGACLNFFLFKENIAVTGFMILVISDTLASLVGKSVVSQPFFEKSLAGSIAFFISALIILIICGNIYHVRFWFYLFGLFAIFCTTMLEARPSLIKIDDNFLIPISFSLIMTIFDIMWKL